ARASAQRRSGSMTIPVLTSALLRRHDRREVVGLRHQLPSAPQHLLEARRLVAAHRNGPDDALGARDLEVERVHPARAEMIAGAEHRQDLLEVALLVQDLDLALHDDVDVAAGALLL